MLPAAAEEAGRLDAEVAHLRRIRERERVELVLPSVRGEPADAKGKGTSVPLGNRQRTFSLLPSITAYVYFASAASRSALMRFFSCNIEGGGAEGQKNWMEVVHQGCGIGGISLAATVSASEERFFFFSRSASAQA